MHISYFSKSRLLIKQLYVHLSITFQSQNHHPGWIGPHPNIMGSYSLPRQFTGQGAYMSSDMDHLYQILPSDQQVYCLLVNVVVWTCILFISSILLACLTRIVILTRWVGVLREKVLWNDVIFHLLTDNLKNPNINLLLNSRYMIH